jgi:hypothetical protein
MLNGAVDGPQLGAIVMVLAGALVLLERNSKPAISEAAHG